MPWDTYYNGGMNREKALKGKSKENKGFTRVDFWPASWKGVVR